MTEYKAQSPAIINCDRAIRSRHNSLSVGIDRILIIHFCRLVSVKTFSIVIITY